MHTDTHPPVDGPTVAPDHSARDRVVIGLLIFSTFTVILNETIMGVALPRLMVDLEVTANAAQWLTTAFLLTMAVVIPVTGFMIKQFTTRTVFISAMSFFSLGTAICAVAPDLGPLIFGRVVQAIGTAMMMPLLMTTVMTLVPPQARGKTMGNISIVISVAPAIGPTISGIILNLLSWRWMFIIVLPVALGALALGYFRLQNVSEPKKSRIDIISVPLSAIGFGSLVYGLSTIGEGHGEGGPIPVWLPIVVGVVVLIAFALRQLKLGPKDRALLDLRTFRIRVFTVGVIMMGLAMMGLFGMIILLPIFMQNVLMMEPLEAGLLLLPGGLTMGLMAPWVGRTFDRIGARKLVIPGAVAVCLSLAFMSTFTTSSTIYSVLGGHMLLSVGLALLFTPLFTSSLGSLPPDLYPHGSAVLGTVQQVAGAAGIALFVSIMSIRIGTEMAGGMEIVEATAAGLRTAFATASGIAVLMIIAGFFVRRPPDQL